MGDDHDRGVAGPTLTEDDSEFWVRYPLQAIAGATEEFGALFTVHRPDKPPRVHVGNPEALRGVFIEHEADLPVCGSSLLSPLVGEHSIGVLNGVAHRHYRRVLAPPIHGTLLRRRGERIRQIVTEEIARGPGDSISFRNIAPVIALRVMVLYCFGELPAERANRLCADFDAVLESIQRAATDPAAFHRACSVLDATIAAEMDRFGAELSAGQADSLLGHLAAATDDQGLRLPLRAIRDQLVTMLVAGQESTPTALVHAVYLAHRNPEIRRRLCTELAGAGEIDTLRYLDAFHAEVLRVASVVPTGITRHCVEDFQVAGHDFPAGADVVPCIHGVHRREDLYPEPDVFEPERFLRRTFSGTEFLPYGLGARRCLGAALASYEIKIVLATIMTDPTIEVRLHGDGAPPPQRPGPTVTAPDSVELVRSGGESDEKENMR